MKIVGTRLRHSNQSFQNRRSNTRQLSFFYFLNIIKINFNSPARTFRQIKIPICNCRVWRSYIFYFFISSQIIPLLGLDTLDQRVGPTGQSVVEFLFGPVSLLSNTFSGIFCLALFEAAYITEIVRSGIQSVSTGQREAAMSIGLSRWQQMHYVVLPQAVQRVIPPLAGQFIILIKDSSIVSLISIQELTFLTLEVANSTQRVFEVWVFVAGVYFVLCYSCALIFRRLEMLSLIHI